jgi:hypothetical protein
LNHSKHSIPSIDFAGKHFLPITIHVKKNNALHLSESYFHNHRMPGQMERTFSISKALAISVHGQLQLVVGLPSKVSKDNFLRRYLTSLFLLR